MAARGGRRARYSTMAEDGEINLTPLLDVIFNLIFFFILATTLRTEETFFDLVLPTVSESPAREAPTEIPEVVVLREGGYALGGQNMDGAELEARLRELARQSATPRRAILSADATATVQQAADAMEILRKAGFNQVIQRVSVK